MKNYTCENPVYSENIKIIEPTDPAHADAVNAASIQLLQNTLVLNERVKEVEDNTSDILSGTSEPDASIGKDGDIYIRYV